MSGFKADGSIHGEVASGFEAVQDEFERNFTERGELGAACCVYRNGEKVVDLWGGFRDAAGRKPWEEDTLILVFSTTKGISSMALALAHSRGWLDFDEKVATYWPEFAQQGKGSVTVKQLLSHQAGIPVVERRLTPELLADLDALADVIAGQKPLWEPGTKHGYHAISLGFLQGELLRRVDPMHRSLGRFFQEEIAGPLGIEFYIGTPADIPDSRIAEMIEINPLKCLFNKGNNSLMFLLSMANPMSLAYKSFFGLTKHANDLTGPPLRHLEIPASNGIGQVRGLARAFGVFATGGNELGLKKETMHELCRPASPPSGGSFDMLLKSDISYSLGYWRPNSEFSFGSSGKAFASPGLGGCLAVCDPDIGVGYAFAMNRMGYQTIDEPREKAVRDALYGCLG